LGLFESVIWDPDLGGRGFDPNFLNPVIFFKTIEFQSGTRGGNTLLGLNMAFSPFPRVEVYGQFLLDEMTVSKFFGDPGYWGNKFATQIGANALMHYGEHIFFGRIEWNRVRPYTYSHHNIVLNYAHDNYPLAHPYGANLSEFVTEWKWKYRRFSTTARWIYALQGVDDPSGTKTYGADIYRDYEDRISDEEVRLLQGNLLKRSIIHMETSYLINPVWHLEGFVAYDRIVHDAANPYGIYQNVNDTWIHAGLRANLHFYHFDY
jgi:hypothetical protein